MASVMPYVAKFHEMSYTDSRHGHEAERATQGKSEDDIEQEIGSGGGGVVTRARRTNSAPVRIRYRDC